MWVCSCNGVQCCRVRDAARSGADTVSKVYRALGVRPNCGRCGVTIRDLIREENRALQTGKA